MSFYGDERKAQIRAINEQNKRRSRAMEQRIAKALGGNRIPMSGAGSIKGDARVLTQRFGEIMLECKYSASMHSNTPSIRIDFRWFTKLDKDVRSMRSSFGALVFHYHNDRLSDYVMVRTSIFEKIANMSAESFYTLDSKGRVTIEFMKKKLDVLLKDNNGFIRVNHLEESFVVMELAVFKEFIRDDVTDSLF